MTIVSGRISVAIVLLAALVVGPAHGQALAGERHSKVTIRTVFFDGNPVRDVEMRVVGQRTETRLRSTAADHSLDLTYGQYRLLIDHRAFQYEGLFTVEGPETLKTIALPFPELHGTPERSLKGMVSGGSTSAWVKLASVYGDYVREAVLGRSGEFRFTGLARGEYILSVIDGSTIRPRHVRVLEPETNVTIDLRRPTK